MDRRVFLSTAIASALGLATTRNAFSTLRDHIHFKIRSIVLRVLFSGEKDSYDLHGKDLIAEESARYIRNKIMLKRPDIDVVWVPKNSSKRLRDFTEPHTFRMLFYITVKKVSKQDSQFDGYMGSIALRITRDNYTRGFLRIPSEPFVSRLDKESLNNETFLVIKSMLDRYVVRPIVTLNYDVIDPDRPKK